MLIYPYILFLFTVLCFSSAEFLRTTLVSSRREELALKICCSETPLCHRNAPTAGQSVPAMGCQGMGRTKRIFWNFLFPWLGEGILEDLI